MCVRRSPNRRPVVHHVAGQPSHREAEFARLTANKAKAQLAHDDARRDQLKLEQEQARALEQRRASEIFKNEC